MRKLATTLALSISLYFAQSQTPERLLVAPNQRFLVTSSGKPFFYLADTGWEMLHRLDKNQTRFYLETRKSQGFNCIQTVVLAEEDGLRTPNSEGQLPFKDLKTLEPNELYFKHIDFVIDMAAELGIYLALLPTWGDKINRLQWGQGPVIFNSSNSYAYTKWLANRYKDKRNILWVLGGDRDPEPGHIAIWDEMARGIIEGVGHPDSCLITFHPQGGQTSSTWFQSSAWLDLNMMQTGHCNNVDVTQRIIKDWSKSPIKPVWDGEPVYEDHPICFNARDFGFATAYDVRKSAYWAALAGASGNTYGCHPVWQMYETKHNPVNNPKRPWYEALTLPGAAQMQFVKKLIEERTDQDRMAAQELVLQSTNSGPDYVGVLKDSKGKYLLAYIPVGKKIALNTSIFKTKTITTEWYNPRTGVYQDKQKISLKPSMEFECPTKGEEQDWVLILEAK